MQIYVIFNLNQHFQVFNKKKYCSKLPCTEQVDGTKCLIDQGNSECFIGFTSMKNEKNMKKNMFNNIIT